MNKRLPILIGIILIGIANWLLITPTKFVRSLIDRLDNLGYDLQLRTRVLTTSHHTITSPVAIIDIDDKSLKAEGYWPWPRNKLADLVNELTKQGAAVIAFDIFFAEKEPNVTETVLTKLKEKNMLTASLNEALKKSNLFFNNDAIFAQSIAQNPTILAMSFLPHRQTENQLPKPLISLTPKEADQLNIIRAVGYNSNIAILQNAAHGTGFINIFADHDGIFRRAPLLIEYQDNIYPALALQAVISFLNEKVKLLTPHYNKTKKLEGIQVGNYFIPTDEHGQALIPFIGKSYTFPYYSATDVLHQHIPQNALFGKIVFIGTSATGLGDLISTAIENPFPGVEVQATLVNGILQNDFSYVPAWTYGANLFLIIIFGFISACLFPHLGPRTLSLIILFLPPILLFINNWFWEATGLVLSFLIPVLLVLAIAIFNIIYGYLFESRRREQLKSMFGQYVPEKHIDEMLKTNSDYGLHGEDREMSVLFADIRNFTTISEGMPAATLVDMLNTFFTPMTEIIFKHRGTIDKYVGDLIMAFWGAPLKDKNHARHAIESALEMQDKIKHLNSVLAEHHWPDIQIGIGINSGIMSVGDMGSRFRRNYTVLGDAVNLASRIEGLTKFYGVDIIVTENVQRHQTKFIFRKLDIVRVKGKQAGVTIYEVICTKANLTPAIRKELDLYEKAITFYFQQEWNQAYELMRSLEEIYPDKKLYRLYIERIKEFKENSPPLDWNGIYIHSTK